MGSFGLLRTNVGLTTNIKIMVDSKYNLTLDSIDSNADLSISKLKKVQFNKKNYWDELIKYFYEGIPATTAYYIKYDEDQESMSSDFKNQYDEIYQYGARNISNNKNYSEEFEYFAPLWIEKGKFPKYFAIFRVDGPGIVGLNRSNFKSEILQKLKIIKIFDLTKKTNLGEWLDTNFSTSNQFFPEAPLEMDFRELEFCRWNGINFESGGYVSNSLFIDDVLDEEKEFFELEKFIFDKFKELKVVIPNILNFSFLFDDEPSTPEYKRKWSINRYLGFYLEDIELVRTLSPYTPPKLRSDVVILENNILYSQSNEDPFVNFWSDKIPYYVEYNGNYYKVEKITQSTGVKLVRKPAPQIQQNGRTIVPRTQTTPRYKKEEFSETYATKYKIISDLNLAGKQSLVNKNTGFITNQSTLIDENNNSITIQGFDDSDVWVIEVDGIFHNINKLRSSFKINSDYYFDYSINKYSYKVAGVTTTVDTTVDFNNVPKKWSIYRVKFQDIKDFDDRIIDTEFSRFEYEKNEDLTNTDESKFYFSNLNSGSNPPSLDDFNYKGNVVNIPVSSEYTANQETFKIEQDKLTNLWRKNSEHCRWSYQGSLSANDYPYLLNNSSVMEDFNKGPNTYEKEPKRIERNLDYFYTINSSTSSYIFHSLHVCAYTQSNFIDTSFEFELNKYLGLATYSVGTNSYATYSYDYFSHLFDRKVLFDNGKIVKNSKKYSIVNYGDKVIPNLTLFKGIKFFIYDVDSIKKSENGDLDINLKNSNNFEDYKFSILLSDNDWSINNSNKLISSENLMNWTIIDEWKMDTYYDVGTITIFDDILYSAVTSNIIEEPVVEIGSKSIKAAPYNNTSKWKIYNATYSIFWNPTKTYNSVSTSFYDYIVFNNGEYYIYNNSGTEDFWNPTISAGSGYGLNQVVLYKEKYYMSMTSSNNYAPDVLSQVRVNNKWKSLWVATQSSNPKWTPIELWNPGKKYTTNPTYTVHNDTVYKTTLSTIAGEEPGVVDKWQRLYSMTPDTDLVYNNSSTGNPIIRMNNKYYLINSNLSNSTLDNGITIYINKKWKNILVNINIADNTLSNISGQDRDLLYIDLNKKLTANNFIMALNDIRNKYGFTDYVNYVVIEKDGTFKKYNYNLNVDSLPHVIICETAEDLDIKVESLIHRPYQLTGDLVPTKSLNNGLINNISELNYYNNTAVGSIIIENKFEPKVFENYHGNQNFTKNRIYRFSGNYTPLFYDVDLFQKNYETTQTGNYKFDVSLSTFGIMKERRISKVNRKGNILKLKNSKDNRPIFPMLDEFGYTIDDFFIFSSTWDTAYHVETSLNEVVTNDVKPFVPSEILTSAAALTEISGDDETLINIYKEIGQPNIEEGNDVNNNLNQS